MDNNTTKQSPPRLLATAGSGGLVAQDMPPVDEEQRSVDPSATFAFRLSPLTTFSSTIMTI
jgi:hypothetical protein